MNLNLNPNVKRTLNAILDIFVKRIHVMTLIWDFALNVTVTQYAPLSMTLFVDVMIIPTAIHVKQPNLV
jgi:hypothetical protein